MKRIFYLTLLAALTITPAFPQLIPHYADSTTDLTQSSRWAWTHDVGTHGWSSGSSRDTGSPSMNGAAREFYFSYKDHGGEIYHQTFAHDETSTHFVYDTYVFLVDPSQVQNLEMDLNQVLSNGKTVIYANQCSSVSGTWEWASVIGKSPHWHPSNLRCNPREWTPYKWHHIQIASHRDGYGNVTHDWVSVDGDVKYFKGAYGYAGIYLGWTKGDLLLNLQLDGEYESGSITAYLDKLHVYRW